MFAADRLGASAALHFTGNFHSPTVLPESVRTGQSARYSIYPAPLHPAGLSDRGGMDCRYWSRIAFLVFDFAL